MFKAESNLHNVGQFWNFAHLIGLRSVQCIQTPKQTLGCVTAQMPNGNYVRYSILKDLAVIQNLKDDNFYNSSMNPSPAGECFLKHHFNIDDDSIVVQRVVCGISGAGVIFVFTGSPQVYFLEVITTARRPKGL